jgi:hypothetical protein
MSSSILPPHSGRDNAVAACIAEWLRVFVGPDEVVELRILDVDRKGTIAGYYDDHEKLATDAVRFNGRGQIYFTLNTLDPALVGRYCNRLEEWAKVTTTDKDIIRRRWLFLDFDPTRPAGVSANEGEKASARAVMLRCREWLKSQGWPEPVIGDSGNGWHLLYRIHLPNDDEARQLLEKCLEALSFQFSDDKVKVDETTFNAARICKLYGVIASKGDDTTGKSKQPPRPHRYSRLVKIPDPVETVPLTQLAAMAATLPKAEADDQSHHASSKKRKGDAADEIDDYLRRNGLEVAFDAPWGNGAHKWVLKRCPWNDAHTNRSAYVIRFKNGAMVARCHHDGCKGKDWRDMPGDRPGTNVGKVGQKKRIRPLPPYVPFPVDQLPPVAREYAIAAAEAIGCDVALVAVPMLSVLAAAIGNSRALILKKGWVDTAVVWSVTIADSGGHKSPAWDAAVNPFVELQMLRLDAYDAAVMRYDNDRTEWAARPKDERGEEPKAPEEPPRLVTKDTTIETVGELLRDAPRGLLVGRDELDGWFQSFVRYKGRGGGSDRACWLELQRAGTLIVDRLTRERGALYVRRACASITGTIQPGTLARALDQDALEAGLGARFLMTMPPRRQRVWSERELPDDVTCQYRDLLDMLLSLQLRNVTQRDPYVVGMSSIAKANWVAFYNAWGRLQHASQGEQAFALAKLEGYAARLALIHHVVSDVVAGSDGRATLMQPSMDAGIALVKWFAGEAARVYAMLHEDEDERRTRKLFEWIACHGDPIPGRSGVRGETVKGLQRSNSRHWPTSGTAEAELGDLVAAGLGEWVEDAPRPGGGRRKRWFVPADFAPDVSDLCSDDDEGPSDDCSDDCFADHDEQAEEADATACRSGTYESEADLPPEQSSETSDAIDGEVF